jgi:hypothetical protein
VEERSFDEEEKEYRCKRSWDGARIIASKESAQLNEAL